MNGSLRITSAIVATLMLGGCAATAQNAKPTPAASKLSANDPACLGDTRRLASAGRADCSMTVRSYSSEDIARTGKTDVGDALALMDPSITVHR